MARDRDESAVRVVIADDHAMVRNGLRVLLDMEPDIEVVAEADRAAAPTRSTPTSRPLNSYAWSP